MAKLLKAYILILFFSKARRYLKGYLKVFEDAIIENAPKIGIEVKLFDKDIQPLKNTNIKLLQNFRVFLLFYGSYLEPYSIGKETVCFFCSECKCIVYSRIYFVAEQTHLKNKIFPLQFLMNYYDKRKLCQDSYIEKAWKDFKRNVSKGFPNLSRAEMLHFLENLYMPPHILPGTTHNKNIKHVCISKKYRQEMLKNNFIMDQNDINYAGDQTGDNEVSERDSNDLSKEEDSIEKELVKAKTNSQLSSLAPIKEEEAGDRMYRRLDKEYDEMEEDKVFIEEPSSLHEVASTNKITPDLLNSKQDLFITAPDGRRLIAKAELNPGAFL